MICEICSKNLGNRNIKIEDVDGENVLICVECREYIREEGKGVK